MILENETEVGSRVNLRPTKFGKLIKQVKTILNSKEFPYMILLLLTSCISVLGARPFAYALLGVATIFNIPLLYPLIGTIISFAIFKAPVTSYITYLATYFIYLLSTVLISVDLSSKKYSTVIRLEASFLVASILVGVFNGINVIGLLQIVLSMLILAAVYPVFTSGTGLAINIRKKMIFSKEETISFGIILGIILTIFSDISIMNFSISNVLLLVLVIILSWKNDWAVGTASGVIIGLMYCVITGQSTLVITTCGLAGLVSGVLSKFGKLPVVLVFAVGNIVLSYLYTSDLLLWSKFAEILVASSVIIALPKKAILKIEEIFNVDGTLPRGYENQLGPANEIKSRVGAIGEVFDNLAYITTPVSEETFTETKNVVQKYLEDHKKNECISCKSKANCLADEELQVVAEHIARRLEDNKVITREMLPIECNLKDAMINEIIEIYNNMKLMRIIRQRESEMNTKLAEEYKVVSKLLKKISKQDKPSLNQTNNEKQRRIREELKYLGYVVYEDFFYEDERDISYEFITDILTDIEKAKANIQTVVSSIAGQKMSIKMILNSSKTEKSRIKLVPSSKYILNAVVKQIKKIDSAVNGDSYIVTELKDNNKIIAISDGMGSGAKSKEASMSVINMLEGLSKTGISNTDIVSITNKILRTKEGTSMSATLDMCVLNEKKDTLEFIKLGAVPSFVITDGIVNKIEVVSDAFGVSKDVTYVEYEHKVKRNTYIVMMSDGALSDVTQKILQGIIDELGENISETSIMDRIMNNIVNGQNKLILDDITIIVSKVS